MKKLKKISLILLAVCFIFSTFPWISFSARANETKNDNGFDYAVYYGQARISKYIGEGGDVVVPDQIENCPVTDIGTAFSGITSVTSVTLPDTLTKLDTAAFSGCTALTAINIGKNSKLFSSENGILYSLDGKTLMICPAGYSGSFSIPETVTSLSANAFYGCAGLTGIEFSPSISEISENCFARCTALTSVTVPETITKIGNHAFFVCSALRLINLPDSLEAIGVAAFNKTAVFNDPMLWSDNVLYVGKYLVAAKTGVSGICTVKDGTRLISDYALTGCTSISEIIFPESLEIIGEYALCGCNAITKIEIPSGVKYVNSHAFEDCTALEDITLADETVIGEAVFDNTACINNQENRDNGVLYIGNHLISADNTLSGSYEIKPSTARIAPLAFYYCENLTEITIPENVKSIGHHAFQGCTALKKVTVNSTCLEKLDAGAFFYCSALESITLGESVAEIGDSAFEGCESLSYAFLSEGLVSLGSQCFKNCAALKNILLPDSLKNIGNYALGYKYNTESGKTVPTGELTVTSYEGSAAQRYAAENNAVFISLGSVYPGNPDGDEAITSADALMIMMFRVGKLEYLTQKQFEACDVNRDGNADSTDALLVLQYSVGNITGFDADLQD